MQLQNIRWKIRYNPKISRVKEKFILNVYHELFTKMYGHDYYDSYLEIILSKSYKKPPQEVLDISPNSQKLLAVLDSLKNDSHIMIIEIYDRRKLIGVGRIEIKDKALWLKEIALLKSYQDYQKMVWEKILDVLNNYANAEDFSKLYVEIPLKEVDLILLLDRLGFKEDPNDMKTEEIVYTSIWNKMVVSK